MKLRALRSQLWSVNQHYSSLVRNIWYQFLVPSEGRGPSALHLRQRPLPSFEPVVIWAYRQRLLHVLTLRAAKQQLEEERNAAKSVEDLLGGHETCVPRSAQAGVAKVLERQCDEHL